MVRTIDSERLDRLAASITRPVLDRLLADFVTALAESRAASEAAARSASLSALRHEAHKLHGMAGTYGAPDVAEAAAMVETAAEEGRSEDAIAAVEPLLRALDAAAAAFRQRG